MTPQPHAPQVKPAALPLVALLLCIGGLCLFPLFPIGFAEKQTYGATAEEINFAPMGATRYLYIVSDDSTLPPTHPEAKSASELLGLVGGGLRTTFGLDGQCPDCNVTMACVGDPDNDGEPDVWTISTGAREVNGVNVPAGIPHNDVADL